MHFLIRLLLYKIASNLGAIREFSVLKKEYELCKSVYTCTHAQKLFNVFLSWTLTIKKQNSNCGREGSDRRIGDICQSLQQGLIVEIALT